MQIFAETERLILRELVANDINAMFEMDSDREVHLYLGNNPFITINESKANIDFIRQQYIENGIGRWAVIEKESENFIGWAGLKLITESCNNRLGYYDLGYRFIKNYWGKGYATETAKAIVDYGFNKMLLPEIIAIADVDNVSSIKVLEKAGLKKEDLFDYNGKAHYWMRIQKT